MLRPAHIVLLSLLCSLAAAACATFLTLHFLNSRSAGEGEMLSSFSAQPAMDYLEDYRCPRAMQKTIITGGVEDGYARGNTEPARYHETLLASPYYQSLISGGFKETMGVRDYDERGADKQLFDYLTLPGSIDSGHMVIRGRPMGSIRTDSVSMWPVQDISQWDYFDGHGRSAVGFDINRMSETVLASDGDRLFILDVMNMGYQPTSDSPLVIFKDVMKAANTDEWILLIHDDMQIDMWGMAICSEPPKDLGTTFHNVDTATLPAGLTGVGCAMDYNKPGCNAIIGNMPCETALPMACYRDGNREPPDTFFTARFAFAPGTIKYSPPVAGAQFEREADVNAYCAAEFGAGWRPLYYHEGGGTVVVTYSDPAPVEPFWIHVQSHPYANCWAPDGEVSQ